MLITFQSVVYIVSSQSIFDSENFLELTVICISLFFFSPCPYLSLKNLSRVAYLLEFLFSFVAPLPLAASSSSYSMSARITFSRNIEKSSLTSTRPVCSISRAFRTHLPITYRLFSPNTFYNQGHKKRDYKSKRRLCIVLTRCCSKKLKNNTQALKIAVGVQTTLAST
jgi:hypothetical protein